MTTQHAGFAGEAPTEPGWYWLTLQDNEPVCCGFNGEIWGIAGFQTTPTTEQMIHELEPVFFGPRIPTPSELTAKQPACQGELPWVGIEEARKWPMSSSVVVRWSSCGEYVFDLCDCGFDASDWDDVAYQFLRLDGERV